MNFNPNSPTTYENTTTVSCSCSNPESTTTLFRNDIEGNKITIYKNDLSKGLYFVRVITDRIYQAKVIVR